MGSGPHSACPRPPRLSFAALQTGFLPLPAHGLSGEGLTRWPLIRGSAYSFRIDVATRSPFLHFQLLCRKFSCWQEADDRSKDELSGNHGVVLACAGEHKIKEDLPAPRFSQDH